jgi:hypothetical protein
MTPNTSAKDNMASHFSTTYGTATLSILDGATVLAVHTLAGFNTPASGLITANAIADDTILANGTADSATLTIGGNTFTLSVGTSGAEVNVNNLTFVQNGTSSISALTVQY